MLLLGIKIGSVPISSSDLFNILAGKKISEDGILEGIIWNVRLPRVVLAYLVGAGLAVSGTVMQSLLGNPLASSYTLGVSAGASLGAALIMVAGISATIIGSLLLPFTGFLFGLTTVFLVLLFTHTMDRQMSNQTVVLVGMVMTLFVGAILTLITALFQDYLKELVFWQMGSFSGSNWTKIVIYCPIAILSTLFLWGDANNLDVLGLGEEQAMLSGVEVKTVKLRIILFAKFTGRKCRVVCWCDWFCRLDRTAYCSPLFRCYPPVANPRIGSIRRDIDGARRYDSTDDLIAKRNTNWCGDGAYWRPILFVYLFPKKGSCSMIQLEKAAVTLQQSRILTDISLTFQQGSKTCILGPNGCGKTTLLKTIAGLIPYKGSVMIDGQEVGGLKRKFLADKVAMMSQFTTVAFDYTVYETVLMGAYRQQSHRFCLSSLNKKKNGFFIT